MDSMPHGMEGGQMQRPNVLYSIINEKTAAGFDALLSTEQTMAAGLLEYLSLNRVVLGTGAFCLIAAKAAFQPDSPFGNLLDANECFAELLEEELIQRTVYHMFPLRGLVVCCISMLQYTAPCEAVNRKEQQIHDYCLRAAEAFHRRADLDVLLAVSPISFGTESLAGSFQCTLDLLQMSAFLGKTDGLQCGSKSEDLRHIFLYTQVTETCSTAQMMLQNRNYDGFLHCVLNGIRELGEMRPYSISLFHANCYRLLDQLCCRLAQQGMMNAELIQKTDLWGMVTRSETWEILEKKLITALDQFTARCRRTWNGKEHFPLHEIQQYMQEQFTSANLSVSAIAEKFGLTQPVFSAYFKKYAGIPPFQYLTSLRLEQAKVLLQTTAMTLPEIAEAVGFGSISTLHRIFKAQTGITPAKFRS